SSQDSDHRTNGGACECLNWEITINLLGRDGTVGVLLDHGQSVKLDASLSIQVRKGPCALVSCLLIVEYYFQHFVHRHSPQSWQTNPPHHTSNCRRPKSALSPIDSPSERSFLAHGAAQCRPACATLDRLRRSLASVRFYQKTPSNERVRTVPERTVCY